MKEETTEQLLLENRELRQRLEEAEKTIRLLKKGSLEPEGDFEPTEAEIRRRQAEEALREVSEKLQAIIEASPLPIISLDLAGRVTGWNPAATRLFGWSEAEVLGHPLPILPEAEKAEHPEFVRRVQAGESFLALETRRRKRDGSILEVNLSVAPLRNGQGEIIGCMGILEDLTARRQPEEALRESEARFRTIFDGAALGIARLNLQGQFLETNAALQKMLGYSAPELTGHSIAEITHPDDVKPYQALFDELAAGIWDYFHWENRYLPQDGRLLWGSLAVSLIRGQAGEPQFAIAMVEDITARKEAEQEVQRLASFPELNPHPVLEVDQEGVIIYANPAAQEVAATLGLPEGVRAFLPPDLKERFAGARQGGPRRYAFDLALKDTVYAVYLSFPHDLPTARLYAFDITERLRMEEALRESEARYRLLVNQIPAVVFRGYADWSLDTFDRKIESLSGYPKEDFDHRRRKWSDLILEEDLAKAKEIFLQALKTTGTYEREYRIRKKSGEVIWVQVQGQIFRDAAGKIDYISGVIFDVSERKRAEEALRESREDLNRAQAVAHTGSWRMNVQRNELTWSEENHRIFGIPEGTPMTYESFLATVHPEDREYVDREWTAALQGEPYDLEHRIVVGDTVKWVRERAELEFDPQGQLLGGFGTTQDITARKRGEEALRLALHQSEQHRQEIEALLRATRAVVEFRDFPETARVIFDQGKHLLGATAGYVSLLDATGTQNELLFLDAGGQPCTVDPSLPMPIRGLRAEAYRTGKTVYDNDFARSDYVRYLPAGHSPLENVIFAPLALEGKALGLIGLANKDGGFNENDARLISGFAELIAIALQQQRAATALRQAHAELEQRVQERTAELRLTVEQLQWEMDERQQAEAAMEFERRRLFSLMEQIPAYVVLLAPDYTVPFANREFVRRFGAAEEGQKCYEFLFGRKEPCPDCQTFKVWEDHQPQEWEWLGPDGRTYAIYDYPFTDADGSSLILEMGLDITDRKRAEETRNQLIEILEAAPDFIATADLNGRVQYVNHAGREMLGIGIEEDISKLAIEDAHPRWAGTLIMEEALPVAQREGAWQGETAFLGRGGREVPASQIIVAHKTADGAVKFFSTIARDITERKQADAKINRINRLYAVLSRINEAIIRLRDPQLLYQEACRIAVEEGRFRLAWIGLVDPDNLSLKPVAHAGWEKGYLKDLKISLSDSPEGRGPTGTALREGRYNICNDIAAEERMAPWREEALRRGYRASAAFPLRSEANIIGALNLYAGEPEFFTAEEIQLLDSLAADLSFAMEAMEKEDRRRQAEKALKESARKLRFLSTELLGAQEKERQRLSRELHDELGHALLILKLHLRTIEKQLLPEQLPLSQEVESLLGYIDEVIEKVRRLYQDLIPGDLEDLGLTTALRHMFDDFVKHHGLIQWSISLDDIDNLYALPAQINIYRITQEVLTNIGKHANPSQVSISIRRKKQQVHFAVTDNGTGFDLEKVLSPDAAKKGLGLVALEERVRMLGGSLSIRSREGAGTKIAFTIPLAKGES
ncbi:MAG: PAS domain S-box protein [Thermodesulfobacteriota bacterium]